MGLSEGWELIATLLRHLDRVVPAEQGLVHLSLFLTGCLGMPTASPPSVVEGVSGRLNSSGRSSPRSSHGIWQFIENLSYLFQISIVSATQDGYLF